MNRDTIEFQLNGQPAKAVPGETILQAAKRAGIAVPHLCFKEGMDPAGNCRACVVEVAGERTLAPSCCRVPSVGMKVETASPRAVAAQKMVLELLQSDAGEASARVTHQSELLMWADQLQVPQGRLPLRESTAPDTSHPAFEVNLDACIQCTRCIRACRDLQVNDVLGLAARGHHAKIVFDQDDSVAKSTCVACGECVQACPTGALMPARGVGLEPIHKQVDSVCPYCGVGCALTWQVGRDAKGEESIRYATGRDGPANHGRLCVKGRFGYDYVRNNERLTVPLIRREGVAKDPKHIDQVKRGELPLSALFREASWDEALDAAASGLKALRDSHPLGKDSPLAGFGSAKGSNEEAYLFQKLVRTGFGTNNVDHCTRLCHASSVAALLEGVGSGAVSNPVEDVALADFIMVIGANPSSNHPVGASWIKNAVKRGAKLALFDPRATPLTRHATWHLDFRPDSDVALLTGMLHVIIAEGLTDPAFIAQRVNGFEALAATVAEATPERMSEICGIPAATIREVARAYATSKGSMILWGMGISQHVHGTDNARCLIALAMVTGQIGRPGTGLHPLRGQNNVQGASDAGLIPMMLPNYQRVVQADVRAHFEALWATPLSDVPGLTVVEVIHAADAGRIKGMYVEGENPAMSDPDLDHARGALAKLAHLVVQDIFPTETALLADVVLPASAWAEKWGTVTNTDRLIQVGRPALNPPGSAKQDLWAIEQIGRRLGLPWTYWQTEDGDGHAAAEAPVSRVYEEMRGVMAPLTGVSWARLVRQDAVMTPAMTEDDPGQAVVFTHDFPTADGKATLVPARFMPGPEQPDTDYPLVIATGRVLEHWHTGSMTRRADMLDALAPQALVSLHPTDAAALNVVSGQRIRVQSRHGQIDAVADVNEVVRLGQLFVPFAYWEAAANKLTGDAIDPFGKIPGFKVTAVKVLALAGQPA
ncbi:formate dehydrogenase, alpha subunit, archaeal-type [Burkholderiales bacterium JOSHI_001]|nr:formate dehydrogenase, alpha subunit, archaeal-type [Burkholderiales bacterium JOSHI_001]